MSDVLRFSLGKNNSKLAKLEKLTGKKVYSISALAGVSCPGAQDCLAKAVKKPDGGYGIWHGPKQQFTCFAASLSVAFPNVRKQWEHNTDLLKSCKTKREFYDLIKAALPGDAEIVRVHVSGDYISQKHFDAWMDIARDNPKIWFYSYTKSLPFWVQRLDDIPDNFSLTASFGGRYDSLIHKHGLRYSQVVFSEKEADDLNLLIDNDDSTACLPSKRQTNLALLLHGKQQKNTKAAEALKLLNKKNKKPNKKVKNV